MMYDHNLRRDWPKDTPVWVKSLVSSLARQGDPSPVLPLIVSTQEIADWSELASGTDAWANKRNRESLALDLDRSAVSLGPSLSGLAASEIVTLQRAFRDLDTSPRFVLAHPPGSRTEVVWRGVLDACEALLGVLGSDEAVLASWDDLVVIAKDNSCERREFRPVADLLFTQLQRRGLDAKHIMSSSARIVAYGHLSASPRDQPIACLNARLMAARTLIAAPADDEAVVVWLGYKGRTRADFSAGNVMFCDAQWSIHNAAPGRQAFDHKDELWRIVEHGIHFSVDESDDEGSNIDTLVRVDLGSCSPAGAVERAATIVETILGIAIHREGGIRPRLAEWVTVQDGEPAGAGAHAAWSDPSIPDDQYGVELTSHALAKHGPRIAEALARHELPHFLAAATEAQIALDRPFGRDMALRTPSEADIASVIPLADRVVQNVAAYASLSPGNLFKLLGALWPHRRWLADLRWAVSLCLSGSRDSDLHVELSREWYSQHPAEPWILLVADRAEDFLSICRVEHERAWIRRMFASISDRSRYTTLLEEYQVQAEMLEFRRARERNALLHGNPTRFAVIESVRGYAEFLSATALYRAVESFIDGTDAGAAMKVRTKEFLAMQSGQDAATYWRSMSTKATYVSERRLSAPRPL